MGISKQSTMLVNLLKCCLKTGGMFWNTLSLSGHFTRKVISWCMRFTQGWKMSMTVDLGMCPNPDMTSNSRFLLSFNKVKQSWSPLEMLPLVFLVTNGERKVRSWAKGTQVSPVKQRDRLSLSLMNVSPITRESILPSSALYFSTASSLLSVGRQLHNEQFPLSLFHHSVHTWWTEQRNSTHVFCF